MPAQYDFPAATHLAAGAQGQPGKRAFYLEAGEEGRWVRAWVEKEVLQALAEAIDQLLAQLARQWVPPQGAEASPAPAEPRPGEPAADFRVGRLALGYDEARGHLVLVFHAEDTPEQAPATLRCSVTPGQMRALSEQIKAVCAAGRPRCPLCGGPVDPTGHPCPRGNGHRPLTR